MDIFFQKANDDFLSNFSPHDLMVDHNINSFYVNPFELPEQGDMVDNGFFSNNLSTNFFSKIVKQEEDKC